MMGKRLVGFFVVLAVLLASVAAPLFQPSAVLATAPDYADQPVTHGGNRGQPDANAPGDRLSLT